eukprot:4504789-Prymnesium_polylepis.1
MLPRIEPGNGSARLNLWWRPWRHAHALQTQARTLQCGLAAPTPAVHDSEDRESGLRGGGPQFARHGARPPQQQPPRHHDAEQGRSERALRESTDEKADGGRVPAQASQERPGIGVRERRHGD